LKALKEQELKKLKAAFEGTSDPFLVRSAFLLPKKQHKVLKDTIDEVLAADTSLKFEEIPDMIGGIELSNHGYKLAWSISEYLLAFEESISKTKEAKPMLEKQDV
jgi:F-type H+-transporting ATPase subunit b